MPPKASAARDSDRAGIGTEPPAAKQPEVRPARSRGPRRRQEAPALPLALPVAPLLPEPEIFDEAAVSAELATAALAAGGDERAFRAAVVQTLSAARQRGAAAIEAAFTARPLAARETIHAQAWLTDRLVIQAFAAVNGFFAAERRKLTVIAVGGYGRGEMAPHSDVDLLFLTPAPEAPRAKARIEAMLYILWDLKLKVGHASRTIADCLALARQDATIATALLEHRYVAGEPGPAASLHRRLRREVFARTAPEFVAAKLAERAARHQRQGQRYMLEPNVKEGKGGLRDLQTLYWIAKCVTGVEEVSELVGLDLLTRDEYEGFERAETFLWAVRCHMHYITGRATEQLAFDLQVEVARRMGYHDRGGLRAVERFMQDYFRHATKVGELTRIFLTEMEARYVPTAPVKVGLFRRTKRLPDGYRLVHNRIAIADEAAFLSDKLNLLRIFEVGLRTGYLIHPDAMRLVAANLDLIDEDMRQDREANRIFLDLLLRHGNPERSLRRMNELGVLSAFIPEFEPIVALMQFNVYHHFTVDEHTIQCISTLARIERGEMEKELPLATRIMGEHPNRRVLYVAMFLHDIGKGRPEDHSQLGARIARRVAPRLGLPAEEAETVEWLVRYHLLMSDMAQKRDISDPRTVRDFVRAVRSKRRLDLLYVLTVCDIIGVGPGTWNNWKAMLLNRLYHEAADALENGLENVHRGQAESEARRALREALKGWDRKEIRAEIARHYPPYWPGLDTDTQVVFAHLLRGLPDNEIRIDLTPSPDRDATRVCFALADHPGIFARLAGALALVGANIVDARTYTSKDGYATAAFWVQDGEGSPYDPAKLPRLRSMIERTLGGEVVAREALRDRDKVKKRDRQFEFPTSITIDNEGSEIYTIIEVDTRDRPGLLYDLARTLASNNIYIATAQIATYGAQVVDTFYVKDMFGLKLYTKSRIEALEKKLKQAIAEGTERARA